MAYYTRIQGTSNDITVNLNAVNSSAFPTAGGTYACSTSNAAPYDFANAATNYYVGGSRIYSNYGGTYTLSLVVSDGSYISSYKVNRVSSAERGASAAEIVNNSSPSENIYRGDVLSKSVTAQSSNYSAWNPASITAPVCRGTGTAGKLYIQNTTGRQVTAYYSTDNSSWTSIGTLSNGSSTTKSLSSSTTYYTRFAVASSREKYTYGATGTFNVSGDTPTVNGNIKVTFTGTRTSTTESGTIYSYNSTKTGPHTITISANNTGVRRVYYNTNGSTTSYANTSSSTTLSLCYGKVVYYYVTYESEYMPKSPSTAGNASSPHTMTVGNSDTSIAPTAKYAGECTTILEKCTNAVRRSASCPSQGCLGSEGYN